MFFMIPEVSLRPEEVFSAQYYNACSDSWDRIAKPLDGLGELERTVSRIGGIRHTDRPHIGKRSLLVFIADNEIIEEGVSQSGFEVTHKVAEALAAGISTVCVMAAEAKVTVCPVDVGMKGEPVEGIRYRRVREGARNFLHEAAMTAEECEKAIRVGYEAARDRIDAGEEILLLGEMGIGNTSSSTAVSCALLGKDPAEYTGRGSGLSDEGFRQKIRVLRGALSRIAPLPKDPFEILREVGGFDLAAMAGAVTAAAERHTPVVLDGLITLAGALIAERMAPGALGCCIASHLPKEPMGRLLVRELGLHPVIDASIALGEGTGAVLLMPLLDAVLALYDRGSRFETIRVGQYERFGS